MSACMEAIIVWSVVVGVVSLLAAHYAGNRRREEEELRERVRAAKAKILADGIVEGPKDEFKARAGAANWGHKWIEYAHSLPSPQARRVSCVHREMPRMPRRR